MNDAPKKPGAGGGLGLAIFVLMSALALTLIATLLTVFFFRRIPLSQRTSLLEINVQARLSDARARATAETRDARTFWEMAVTLSGAIAPNSHREQIPKNLVQNALAAGSSQLGRLLGAGAVFHVAESEGRSAEQTWVAVKPYLEGLETAKFGRFDEAHENLLTSVYHAGNMQLGSSRQLAADTIEAYTPFLQYFVGKLNQCIENRTADGDSAAAELCRKIKMRLLRDWTVEPGRAETRLLAAELLRRELAAQPTASPIVNAITKWRSAYTAAAKAHPSGFFSPSNGPDMSGGMGRSMSALLIGSTGLAIATFILAIAGIAMAWPLLSNASSIRSPVAWILGAVSALIVLGIGIAVLNSGFQAAENDLNGAMQRMARSGTPVHKSETWLPVYWARLPWNAAALGVIAAVVAIVGGRLVSGAQQRRNAASVAICWLILAASWTAISGLGLARMSTYEARIDAAYRRGAIATLLGDAGDAMLAPVRDWQP